MIQKITVECTCEGCGTEATLVSKRKREPGYSALIPRVALPGHGRRADRAPVGAAEAVVCRMQCRGYQGRECRAEKAPRVRYVTREPRRRFSHGVEHREMTEHLVCADCASIRRPLGLGYLDGAGFAVFTGSHARHHSPGHRCSS